jgi:enolase
MLVPHAAKSFEEAMQIGTEVYHTLRQCLIQRWGTGSIGVGDEGGFAPNEISSPTLALELIQEAVERSRHQGKVAYALDVAASEFAVQTESGETIYDLSFKEQSNEKNLKTGKEMIQLYCDLCDKFPIISIEDPFGEDDWTNWTALMSLMKQRGGVQLIGDDLCVTNPDRIKKAHELGCCNGLLVKPNQIGTVTETMEAVRLARSFGWFIMASHRSGDTEDSFIADLAVGVQAEAIKCGAPCRSERVVKYNRLLWIERHSQGKCE